MNSDSDNSNNSIDSTGSIKKNKYSQAKKKADLKYYSNKYHNDEKFKEMRKEYNKMLYWKKKALKYKEEHGDLNGFHSKYEIAI